MSRRRRDRFKEDMARISRARQRRRAFRDQQRAYDNASPWDEVKDEAGFKAQELGALGKDVGRGAARELGRLGKDIAVESLLLVTDALTAILTLGYTEKASVSNRLRARRRQGPRRR